MSASNTTQTVSRTNSLKWIRNHMDEIRLDNESQEIGMISQMIDKTDFEGGIGLTKEMIMGSDADEKGRI